MCHGEQVTASESPRDANNTQPIDPERGKDRQAERMRQDSPPANIYTETIDERSTGREYPKVILFECTILYIGNFKRFREVSHIKKYIFRVDLCTLTRQSS